MVLPQSISFARLYPLLLNSEDSAGLYLLPDKTLIFKLSGIIPVPIQTETHPSLFAEKHNSICR